MSWLILEKCFWSGSAALGFSVLFNVPPRTLFVVWLLGACGGFVKLVALDLGMGPVMAAFLGALAVGFWSIPAAHNQHAPPLVFSIAAVIPMVPGIFAAVPYCIDLIGGPYLETHDAVCKAFRPKSAVRAKTL